MAWSDKDLVSFLELNPELKQLLDQKVETRTYNDTVKEVDNHIIDKVVHITEDERNTWNSSLSDAKTYTDSMVKDITAKITETTTDVSKAITDHIADTAVHVSADERTKWNSLAGSSSKYTDDKISALSSDIKEYVDSAIKELTTKLLNGELSPIKVNGYRITISDSYPADPVKDHEILLMPSRSKLCHFDGLNWVDIYSVYK